MGQIIVRKLDDDLKRRLRERAQRHGVSMEEEARRILETENENLKQKAELAALSFEKLQLLEKQMQELQKPKPSWWQKWFASGGAETHE